MCLRKAAARAFDPLGFTLYEVMLLLSIEEGVGRPHELRELLDVSAPAVSGLVTKLMDAGLVSRNAAGQDARKVSVRLTTKGCVAVHLIRDAWTAQAVGKREKLER